MLIQTCIDIFNLNLSLNGIMLIKMSSGSIISFHVVFAIENESYINVISRKQGWIFMNVYVLSAYMYIHNMLCMYIYTNKSLFLRVVIILSFTSAANMIYYIFPPSCSDALKDQSHKKHIMFSTQTHAHDKAVIRIYSTIHHPALCAPSKYYSLK